MTEKVILLYNLFCHEIFQRLVYFLCKNCNPPPHPKTPPPHPAPTPLKKVTSSFPGTPLKLRSSQAAPFWKFGRRFNPTSRKWQVHNMCKYVGCMLIIKDLLKIVVGQTSPNLTYTIKYNYNDTLQDLAFSEHQLGVIFANSVLKPKILKIYWPKITKL